MVTPQAKAGKSGKATKRVTIIEIKYCSDSSKKLSSAERDYTTGEQELLALITACKEWRCYLEGVPFTLFTDHKPLTALPTQKVLSRRQARWMEFLSRFTFDLQYLPGDANPADPLSRIPAGPQDCAMVCVVTTRRQAKQSLERGEVRVAQALPQVPPVGTPSKAPTAVDALAPRPTVSDNPVAAHHSRLPELEAPSAADTSVHYPAAPAHPLELADHLVHGYRLDPAFTAEADLSGMYMDDHGLWRRTGKGTVMVPNDPELREYILHEMHDAAYAGHVGITKTLERLSRVFYWDTMRADVRHYVTTCDACQRDKSSTLKPGGLLNPLSIPDYRWESVSMDLITKLPSASHGFDAICVFVDRLSKMVHFVPCKESMNAKGFARLFVDNVFKLHGLPKDMVSDRGPHFHNTFWHHVQKLLGMRGSLSSSYHPQSDGQTERYNRVLEEMLRHYISPTQADWPDYLSLAELAVNNSWQESIKSTPFLVNTGQSPITPMLHSLPDKGRCPEGLSYATWWQEAVAKAKLCMQAAQQRQAAYANQDRREVHYKVGQMVLLSTKNMRLKPGKARKLLPRFVGPFKVLGLVGQVAVNLQLPASMSRLHPVFHVSLIKPYTGTDVGFMPPPVEWLDEEPVYYVERLLDHRHVHAGKAKEYLVQWEGYDADHNTWEPRSNLVGCDKILAEYHAAHNLKQCESRGFTRGGTEAPLEGEECKVRTSGRDCRFASSGLSRECEPSRDAGYTCRNVASANKTNGASGVLPPASAVTATADTGPALGAAPEPGELPASIPAGGQQLGEEEELLDEFGLDQFDSTSTPVDELNAQIATLQAQLVAAQANNQQAGALVSPPAGAKRAADAALLPASPSPAKRPVEVASQLVRPLAAALRALQHLTAAMHQPVAQKDVASGSPGTSNPRTLAAVRDKYAGVRPTAAPLPATVTAPTGHDSNSRRGLPVTERWTDASSTSGRRALSFLEDLEAHCVAHGLDPALALPSFLSGKARDVWFQSVRDSYALTHSGYPTWPYLSQQFLEFVGEDLTTDADAARAKLLDSTHLRMTNGVALSAYITDFRNTLTLAGKDCMTDSMLVNVFQRGLSADLRGPVAKDLRALVAPTLDEAIKAAITNHKALVAAAGSGVHPASRRPVAAVHQVAQVQRGLQNLARFPGPPPGRPAAPSAGSEGLPPASGYCYHCGLSSHWTKHCKRKASGMSKEEAMKDAGTWELMQDLKKGGSAPYKAAKRDRSPDRGGDPGGPSRQYQGRRPQTARMEALLQLNFDVLLGNDWLNEHEAVMSYQDKTLSLACDKGEPVVLPCPPADKSESGQSAVSNPASFLVNALRAKPPLASAKVAARWLRKGGTGGLALITVDNSSTPDPAPAEPDLPPGVSQALNALLDEYADVFAPITSLPPERPVGHAIPLVPDARPSVVPQYRMSQEEHAELKKQVQDLLAKGMIEPSSSPFAAPILFVKKKSGELRMCLDYRQLNKITIRDQYPLPRIDDLFDKLSGCTVFSSLDLQAGYNQIRITPEDVPKTAFRTPDGHYQFKVLSFGLCNAPATFQRVMNDAFAPVLNQCALVYLDDILVMSKSVDEHLKHLRKVFDLLRLNKLFAKQSKCEFMRNTLKFLGHVIFAGAIAVDPEKIKSISSWPVPQSLQQLQSFLGAANFVRKFVHNFSVLAAPLTDLCGKAGDSFLWQNWPADELKAFASLKAAVAQVPMLRLPDHTQPFQVYYDASLQGVGAVLMQDGYPLAYLSKKLSSAERNYTTGEQELLALITACKEWRCYLEGVPFTLFTDHKPLTALPTQKVLSRRQARWMEFLSRFTFDLQYLPGDANPADPLSRIPAGPQDCAMVCVVTTRRQAKQSLERGEVRVAQALPQVPPVGTPSKAPTAVDALAPRPTVSDNPVAAHHSRLPELEAPSAADTSVHYPAAPAHPLELADHLVHGYRLDPAFTAEADLSGMYMDDHGLWRRTGKGTVMVPNDPELREYILHEMHDAAYAGHVGITKTLERLSRVFYWDTMRADVRHYVTTCDACQRDKSSTLKPGGLLNPLSIPDYRWESVSMDLITKLPSASHGFDAICVFVDRLSKMVHFVPCKESMNAKGFARLFVDNVFKLHGLPKDMVSDRGPHFHNTFWHHVQKLLGMRGSLSSSYHPQSDGQTERYNRVLEEMLRHYISPTQADWPDYLSLAELAVNNSWQESIKSTPFLVNTGQSPITPMLHSLPDKGRCPEGLSYATWWQEAVAKAKLCMQAAQQRQAAYANQDRREVHYKVGQMVLLSTKNMRLKPGKARKLLPRFVGPFKVLGLVGQVAVNLQLPASMSRLHPVFHVSLIKPYTGTDVGFMPPPVEWLDEEPVYYVERLLDHRHVHAGKAKEYLVQWEGYDADHNTWEPRSNLVGCDKILAEYHAAHNLKQCESRGFTRGGTEAPLEGEECKVRTSGRDCRFASSGLSRECEPSRDAGYTCRNVASANKTNGASGVLPPASAVTATADTGPALGAAPEPGELPASIPAGGQQLGEEEELLDEFGLDQFDSTSTPVDELNAQIATLQAQLVAAQANNQQAGALVSPPAGAKRAADAALLPASPSPAKRPVEVASQLVRPLAAALRALQHLTAAMHQPVAQKDVASGSPGTSNPRTLAAVRDKYAGVRPTAAPLPATVTAPTGHDSNSRRGLPVTERWTDASSTSGRRALSFLEDLEAHCVAHGLDPALALPSFLSGKARDVWFQSVRDSYALTHSGYPTWPYLSQQFLEFVGEDLTTDADAARAKLLDSTHLRMTNGVALSAYITDFRNTLTLAGKDCMTDSMLVNVFQRGLSADLRGPVAKDLRALVAPTLDEAIKAAITNHKALVAAAGSGVHPASRRPVAAVHQVAQVQRGLQNLARFPGPPPGRPAAPSAGSEGLPPASGYCYHCGLSSHWTKHCKRKASGMSKEEAMKDAGTWELMQDLKKGGSAPYKAAKRDRSPDRGGDPGGPSRQYQGRRPQTARMEALLQLNFDVLLGNDWLNEHEAVMSYQDKTLSLACDKGEPVVLPCPPADKSESGQSAVSNPASFLVNALRAKPPLASAKVAARWLRKGGTGGLALITVDNSSTPDPAPAEPDLPPGVSQALNALLDEYADVFAPITSLPPERPVGHAIPLVPDARPSVVPQYRMSQEEHAELKKQVQDLLAKGMIEPSSSPFAAPILFVKKKSGELRMCLDYRQLNKITIRDQYPLPRIDDLFDKLSGCTVFSSLDLQAGYNQIRITPEDVPKTAFRTPDGHYQFKVLSFGLCNAPATFQRVMNDAFAPVLNQCALVYLDDILVMSKSVDEHLKHLRKVFDLLRLNKLFAKQSKCEFMRNTLKFLGHVIFAGAIAVDPEKIKSISSWPVPQSLQQLQSFLGAANFVRKFVHNFSVLAAPLTDLCGKAGDSFLWQNWPADELKAFASLKAAVAQVPMLRLPDHTQPFQVYYDASLQGVGAVLMQDGYPLAYLSKKLSSAERNYTTGEQELLALITACKEWRCYLEGVPFTLFTDHKPLTALPTQKVLSRRQARWMEFLSRFTFDLQYLPGDANPADPLSRIPAGPQDCAMVCVVTTRRQAKQSLERGEVRVAQALPQVPPVGTPSKAPTAVDALAPRPTVSDNPVAAHHSRLPELEAPSAADTSVHYPAAPAHPLELADHLVHGYRLDPAFTAEADLSGMYMDDHGLWRRTGKGTVMVPNDPELREYILHEMHDAAYAGHVGITKTLERLSRVFYWDTMRADVRHYVTTCDACQRDKSSTLKPGGLLNPLSIPDYRWESVSMDLITKLPSASHGFDAICVFVDRLSKMVHFVPCKESMNAKGFARLFVDNVFKLHGLPKDMVSDRGPHFHNTFWHHVQKLLGMRGSLSSSYHPQSDGQTERYNRVLEEMLRHYISPTQADWPDYLSLAELAVNNSWQESIKSTPFLVNTGQSPITPMLHSLPDKGRCPEGLSYATWWQEAVAKAKLCMQAAQQRQAAYANQDRREVHYKVGQMVLLSTKNMRLKPGKARKLLPRFVGPFKVLGLVGQVAVNLQLPASMSRLHPVFHVSLIKPYTGTDVGFMPPPVEWLDEEPVYYVERLLDHRHVHAGKAKEYLVQWEGYDADHNTWEPRSNLVGCDKILAEYHAAHNLKQCESRGFTRGGTEAPLEGEECKVRTSGRDCRFASSGLSRECEPSRDAGYTCRNVASANKTNGASGVLPPASAVTATADTGPALGAAPEPGELPASIPAGGQQLGEEEELLDEFGLDQFDSTSTPVDELNAQIATLQAQLVAAQANNQQAGALVSPPAGAKRAADAALLPASPSPAKRPVEVASQLVRPLAAALRALQHLTAAMHQPVAQKDVASGSPGTSNPRTLAAVRDKYAGVRPTAAPLPATVTAPTGHDSNSRRGLPVTERWTDASSTSGRRALSFLEDLEAHCVAHGLDPALALPSFLSGKARDVWFQSVRDSYALTHSGYPTWPYLSQQFLEFVGEDLTTDADAARAKLLDSTHLRMTNGVALSAYITDFRNTLTLAGKDCMTDSMLVNVFQRGLSADLRGPVAKDLRALVAPTLDEAIKAAITNHKALVAAAGSGVHPASRRPVAAVHQVAQVQRGLQNLARFPGPPPGRPAAPSAGSEGLPPASGYCYHCGLSSHWTKHCKRKASGMSKEEAMKDAGTWELMQDLKKGGSAPYKAAKRDRSPDRGGDPGGPSRQYQGRRPQTARMEALLQLNFDVLLGNDWLNEHEAVMSYQDKTLSLACDKGEPVVLPCPPADKSESGQSTVSNPASFLVNALRAKPPLASAKVAARWLRKGGTGGLALITVDNSSTPDPAPAEPDLPPGVSQALNALLDEYADVFAPITSLPPERPVGHAIHLVPDARPSVVPQYRMSQEEHAELKKQVQDLLAKGMIEPSSSPFAAPILFVKKKSGELRMCLDYRQLNKITIRDQYPLPRIDDLFDKLSGCTVFSSLDLQAGYNQIRITPEDVPKTAFRTPDGHYQFKVLSFGLCNAPATFQRVMNDAFAPVLNQCALVYLDDILVMSKSVDEHLKHLRK
ncbi:hypothetical protein QJQ45_009290, partial [Haematococcus lacustris]